MKYATGLAATKRNVALALGLAWVVLLGAHVSTRLAGLAGHWERLHAGAEARAQIEGGSTEYHAFLTMTARRIPPGSRVVILAYDPRREDLFEYYRAVYELFPSWAWFAPITFPPSGKATFTLPVDDKFLELISTKRIELAAVWNRADPARSAVYALKVSKNHQLVFMPPPVWTGPIPSSLLATRHAWGWGLGLAIVVLFGWCFNAATGFSASFAGDRATQWAYALLTGSGLTSFGMLLISLAGIRWNVWTCLLPWAFLPASWIWIRQTRLRPPALLPRVVDPEPFGWVNAVGVALVAASVVLAAIEAAMPMSAWGNWDAWAIWNLKAKAFWFARAVPRDFLQEPLFNFMHPDYPPGLPLLQAFLGYCAGGLHESLLRGLSVLFHLMLATMLARLLGDLGVGRYRWLLAGCYACIPKVLDQASSGYADLLLSSALAGSLVCIVRAMRGVAPAWTVGLTCGLATLIKGEGLIWVVGYGVLLGVAALRSRVAWRAVGTAVALMALLAAPWRMTVRHWQLSSTFQIDPDRLENNLPEFGPIIVKAALLEASGMPLTGPVLIGRAPLTTDGWWTHTRDSWLPLWYAIAAGLVFGVARLLTSPYPELAFLLALQLGASWAVFLGAQYDVVWVCLTSMDRLLLQTAPVAFILAAGAVLGRDAPAPPRPG